MDEEILPTTTSKKRTVVGRQAIRGEPLIEQEESSGRTEDGAFIEINEERLTPGSRGELFHSAQEASGACFDCGVGLSAEALLEICAAPHHLAAVCPVCRTEVRPGIYYCHEHLRSELSAKVISGLAAVGFVGLIFFVFLIAGSC